MGRKDKKGQVMLMANNDAKKSFETMNLTVVALVALVAIVGVTAMVLNMGGSSFPSVASEQEGASSLSGSEQNALGMGVRNTMPSGQVLNVQMSEQFGMLDYYGEFTSPQGMNCIAAISNGMTSSDGHLNVYCGSLHAGYARLASTDGLRYQGSFYWGRDDVVVAFHRSSGLLSLRFGGAQGGNSAS